MVYILLIQFLTDSYINLFIILPGEHGWPATSFLFSNIVN